MQNRFLASPSLLALLLICLVGFVGCRTEQDPGMLLLDTTTTNAEIDDLKRAMDFVRSRRQFKIEEFEQKVSGSLNRWASTTIDETVDWKLDPMVKDLVDTFSENKSVAGIDKVSFLNADAAYLQGCGWSKVITDRITNQNNMRPFEFYRMAADFVPSKDSESDELPLVLKKLNAELSDEASGQLAKAMRTYDWILRNIQLVDVPEMEITEENAKAYEGDRPSDRGIKGLGYVRYPSQVLVYARGDYAERAKLFILMLRQVGLNGIMLSVDKTDGDKTEGMPWCVGVRIDEEVYLFDTKLSMPLPNPKTKGVLTLSELRKDPELLKWFDLKIDESLADDTQYWVVPEQVETIKGLLYVTPEGVSKRMAKLQQNLSADEVKVTSRPTELANEFQAVGVESIEIWPVAFDTHLFRQRLKRDINDSQTNNRLREKVAWYFTDEAYIDGFAAYRSSRSSFLRGHFQKADENDTIYTAIERFFNLMYTEDVIRGLGTDPRLQRRHGILKQNQSGKEYQETLRSVQSQMRLIARDTSYFLAQCHFENGSMNVAAGWLDRIKTKPDVGRWKDGIYYLLGRSLEANREYDRAIEAFQQNQESAQSHGNLIRARMLKSMLPKDARP